MTYDGENGYIVADRADECKKSNMPTVGRCCECGKFIEYGEEHVYYAKANMRFCEMCDRRSVTVEEFCEEDFFDE